MSDTPSAPDPSTSPKHVAPGQTPGGGVTPPDEVIYDLAPVEPVPHSPPASLPKGTVVGRASKVGDKGLTDDFDEDADFTSDPEVERVLLGKPAMQTSADAPVETGPAFVKAGFGEVQPVAIAAGITLLAAVISAGITAGSRSREWYADAILTAYLGVLHAATGAAAVMFAAHMQPARIGDLPLAAARMGLAVASFQLIFHLNIPISGRTDEVLLACIAYAGVVWAFFRWKKEQLALVVIVHAALWGAIYLATGLWYWAQKKTGA